MPKDHPMLDFLTQKSDLGEISFSNPSVDFPVLFGHSCLCFCVSQGTYHAYTAWTWRITDRCALRIPVRVPDSPQNSSINRPLQPSRSQVQGRSTKLSSSLVLNWFWVSRKYSGIIRSNLSCPGWHQSDFLWKFWVCAWNYCFWSISAGFDWDLASCWAHQSFCMVGQAFLGSVSLFCKAIPRVSGTIQFRKCIGRGNPCWRSHMKS